MEERRERRKRRPDPLTRMLQVSALAGWSIIFIVQILVWVAAPEFDNALVRYNDIYIRRTWQAQWVQWLPYLLGICALISLFALGVRPLRSRRRTDPKRSHLVILLALTLVGYAVYWFQILGNTA
ncbi:hypothetical protein [Reinekea thalattae]|uniref:Uncharacterized protein n=1 Tax=Reinekea thalattae TaxID=2593301 RepID=A0A5C8Z664_9GAMM|nr:hypothetical protein [Reinekea thalattae]TXR53107.1 hypothetical protein FME95_00580 [Reinekea thalattae]